MYELFSGKAPFHSENLIDLGKSISQGVFQPLKGCSEGYQKVIAGMIQVNPCKRISLTEIENSCK
jgi:serine/threonine protein kinase